jgi:hypothetical protein
MKWEISSQARNGIAKEQGALSLAALSAVSGCSSQAKRQWVPEHGGWEGGGGGCGGGKWEGTGDTSNRGVCPVKPSPGFLIHPPFPPPPPYHLFLGCLRYGRLPLAKAYGWNQA